MEVEHAFITRRQISDPDENTTRESPEVILTSLTHFHCVLLVLHYCVLLRLACILPFCLTTYKSFKMLEVCITSKQF